jgi:hypothetical protein
MNLRRGALNGADVAHESMIGLILAAQNATSPLRRRKFVVSPAPKVWGR